MDHRTCQRCHATVPPSARLYILSNGGEAQQQICADCYNRDVANLLGVPYEELSTNTVTIADGRRKRHKFELSHQVVPNGSVLEAKEVTKSGTPGYEFAILGSHDESLDNIRARLVDKAKRLMSTQYVESREVQGFPLEGIRGDSVFGRFEYDPDATSEPLVIIDGRPYTWSQFGRLLTQFEGFQFKLDISDMVDE